MTDLMKTKVEMGSVCDSVFEEKMTELTASWEKKFPDADRADKQMWALVERCKDHPGFREAAEQGLQFMKKKK